MERNRTFIWGTVAAVICVAIAIFTSQYGFFIPLAIMSFTLVSCLILQNNFLGDMIVEIFSWGFVRMPGLIFTLDLDGIIWLITVKLLFWVIGILLAILCGTLAIALGLVLSVFVYPFALAKSFRESKVEK